MEEENDEPTPRSERYSLMEDEDWRIRGGSIWNNTQERTTTRVKCRATTCQLVQLVKFMEKHPQLAVSHAKPFPGCDELWMKLAHHINQFGPPKNYKQCKTTWRDLRKRAFAMQRSRNKKDTGRNLYGMAPKIVSLITQAGIAPKYKGKNEGNRFNRQEIQQQGKGRNLYGMAPKIVSFITQAGIAPKYKVKDEGNKCNRQQIQQQGKGRNL